MTDRLNHLALAMDLGFQLGQGKKVDLSELADKHGLVERCCDTCAHMRGRASLPFCGKDGRPIELGEEAEQCCGRYEMMERVAE